MRRAASLLLLLLALASCTGIPKGATPVTGFELDRYLGQWYEIARLDHRFERGLSHVSAEYSLRDDGDVRVVNRGYDARRGEWREAVGRARFVESPDIGRLKVSFFGPFYGGYNILVLDPGYRYALVSGPNHDYLWILARTPTLAPATIAGLLETASALGFDTGALIWPDQTSAIEPDGR